MAVDLTYILTLKDAGDKTFTMPTGFEERVEIHCWGAGGGGTVGASGGGGGYASTTASIPAGSVVRLQVGQPGTNGGRRTGGTGGTHPTYTRYRGGSAGSPYDEDWDTGGGGGGGGASSVLVSNSPVCIGAGGGGAGGPGDDSRAGTPGNPAGVYPGSTTNIYPVTLSYAWNSFMNTYAVWGAGQDYTTVINFPVTGTYTFNYAVDNYGQVFLDGSAIITLSGTVTSHFKTTTTYTATVSAGNHTVRVTGVNTGGPAGVAAQILKPDTTELWNTRALTVRGGLTATSDGGTSANGWTSGGGGGGGYYGGVAGTTYGDDAGNAPGGNGGQNYGAIIESGSGATGAGKSIIYYPRTLVASPAGNITWSETIISYASAAGSILVSGNSRTPGATLVLPPGSIPPGTILLADGTAQSPFPGVSPAGLTTVYRRYSLWTPSVPAATTPVAYIGNAGYPGYIVMIFNRRPGLQIKNPDGSGNWVTINNSYTKIPTNTITVWTPTPPTTNTFTYGTNNFVIPAGVTEISVTATGGGGGGGGGGYGTGGESGGSGAGGGSGFTTTVSNIAVTPGESLSVVVGSGGAGGLAHYSRPSRSGFALIPAYYGGNGTSSQILRNSTILVSAAGGNGGYPGVEAGQGAIPGGTGYNNGSSGTYVGGGVVPGGNGGNGFFTAGAQGIASGSTPGPSGSLGSGGAGGGASDGPDTAAAGGKGGDGRVTINYSSSPVLITTTIGGWKEIQQIYVKVGNVWKSVSQQNDIVIYNYS
jgi:hypothetical protein